MQNPRHKIFKLLETEDKEKLLKVAREKGHIPDRTAKVRITKDFYAETMQVLRHWNYIFKMVKEDKHTKKSGNTKFFSQ